MTCRDAIHEVFRRHAGELTTNEVIAAISAIYPEASWKATTIRTYLIGLSVNHSSAHHYPPLQRHAFLVSTGKGRYRLSEAASDEGPTTPRPRARRKEGPRADRRVRRTQPRIDEAARQDLIRRLVREIDTEPFQPKHRRQPVGRPVRGWPARYGAYFWPRPGRDLRETAQLMEPWFVEAGELAKRLEAVGSWRPAERARAKELAGLMLSWGRVKEPKAFSEAAVESVFRRALGWPAPGQVPMSSGWSKIAALATAYLEGHPGRYPHVIWDSRVSTALTSRLDRMMRADGMVEPQSVFPRIGAVPGQGGSRPRPLRLPWAHAYTSWTSQDAGSALVREIRDHLNDGTYPSMPHPDGGENPWTMRGVESVLFMDGY